MSNLEKTIARAFLEMADGLETGSFGPRPKIALTGMGSEHGEENAMAAAQMAAKKGVDVYYIGTLEAEGGKVLFTDAPALPLASTDLRAHRRDLSAVPEAARRVIEENHLYER